MARGKKKEELTLEEKLERALVPVEEQPYEVPENWCWTIVGNLVDLHRGVSYKKNESHLVKCKNDCLVMRGGNILEGAIDIEAENIYVDKSLVKFEQYIQENDIIIVSSTGSKKVIGRAGISFANYSDVSFGAFLMLVRPKQKLCKRYVDYYFQSQIYRERIRLLACGVNINNIRAEYIMKSPIPLPPLQEQQRIVERIENLFAKLDEVKEKLEDSLRICNERRNSILQKAYSGILTEKWRRNHLNIKNCVIDNIEKYSLNLSKREKKFIEDGQSKLNEITMSSNVCWYQGNIGAVSIVTNGSTPSRKCDNFWNGDIPWVSSGEVRNNVIAYTEERITQEGYDNSSVKLLPIGTVLIAMIGEGKTRGQSAILNIEATTNQNIAAIVIEHGQINSKFLWYWLQKQYKRNREKGVGSGPQALNCQRVRELDFIIPPLEEQNEIVKIIDNLMNKENSIIDSIETTLENVEGIRKSILANAFRGELGTNDSDEMSAIELLKTILVET